MILRSLNSKKCYGITRLFFTLRFYYAKMLSNNIHNGHIDFSCSSLKLHWIKSSHSYYALIMIVICNLIKNCINPFTIRYRRV